MPNFATATIGVEVDTSKLPQQLEKVKAVTTKAAKEVEKSFAGMAADVTKKIFETANMVPKVIQRIAATIKPLIAAVGHVAEVFRAVFKAVLRVSSAIKWLTKGIPIISKLTAGIHTFLKGLSETPVWLKRLTTTLLHVVDAVKGVVTSVLKAFTGIRATVKEMWQISKMPPGLKSVTDVFKALSRTVHELGLRLRQGAEYLGAYILGYEKVKAQVMIAEILAKTEDKLRTAMLKRKEAWDKVRVMWPIKVNLLKEATEATKQSTEATKQSTRAVLDLAEATKKGRAEWDKMSKAAQDAALVEAAQKAGKVAGRIVEKYSAAGKVVRSLGDDIIRGVQQQGQTMYDISGVMVKAYVGAFKAIHDAAEWTFGKIVAAAKWAADKMGIYIKWAVGIATVSWAGFYAYIVHAAMDVEDAYQDTWGTTRDVLSDMRDALKGVAAVIGKPFLPRIRAAAEAMTQWLVKARPQIKIWAEKVAYYLGWVEGALKDWVAYLTTDWRGGVSVALHVITELFKGLAESLVAIMETAGRMAGKALVDSLVGGVTGALQRLATTQQRAVEWLGEKLMKSSEEAQRDFTRLTGIPLGRQFPAGIGLGPREKVVDEEKDLSKRLIQIARERAANIKTILEGMPTWGITPRVPPAIPGAAPGADEMVRREEQQGVFYRELLAERVGAYKSIYGEIRHITYGAHKEQMKDLKELSEWYRYLGVDVQTLTRWYQEQADVLREEYLLSFGDIRSGFQAAGTAIRREITTWAERAYEFSFAFQDAFASGLERSMRDMKNWKDHMLNMLEEVYWKAVRIAFIDPLATGLASVFAGALGGTPVKPTAFTSPHGGPAAGSLQHGGTVLQTGWAKVHKGETYSGVGGGSLEVNINYTGQERPRVTEADYDIKGQIKKVNLELMAHDRATQRGIQQVARAG